MADPDFIYNPDDWEVTYRYVDRGELAEGEDHSMSPGDIKPFNTLIFGPQRFLALVVLSRDEDGDPDETELQWFDTEDAAKAAVASMSGNVREGRGDA